MSSRAIEDAESAVLRARLHLDNAEEHCKAVRRRFGVGSPEYVVALEVISAERLALVRAYDQAIAASRGEVAPCPR